MEKTPECWYWRGSLSSTGYGRFKIAGQTFYAHRVAAAIAGRLGGGDLTLTCGERACVNPAHLECAKPDTADTLAHRRPRRDFPLFAHGNGQWARKVRGSLVYFGKVADDPGGVKALDDWLDRKDELLSGRRRQKTEGATVRELVDQFLTSKRRLVDTGELSARTFEGYRRTCLLVAECPVGVVAMKSILIDDLRPTDFETLRAHFATVGGKKRGVVSLSNEIRHTKILFNWAASQRLIDRPVWFGDGMKPPAKRLLRHARNAAAPRLFEADELRRIFDAAGLPIPSRRHTPKTDKRKTTPPTHPMRALVLLGINCAFGQSDAAELPKSAIDLDGGFITFPRPKTGIVRRCPLWPETIEAIRTALANRPEPKDPSDETFAFLTRQGHRWVRLRPVDNPKPGDREWVPIDAVAVLFGDLLASLGIDRTNRSFYALRHTFRTVADETGDSPAIRYIMGHVDNSIDAEYRERISDERLITVVGHVHNWIVQK